MFKRILSMLLVIVMMMSMVGTSAFAEGEETTGNTDPQLPIDEQTLPEDQNSTPPEDQSSTPSEDSNSTLSEDSNSTPSEDSNSTPSEDSNSTPSEDSNSTPSEDSNSTPSEDLNSEEETATEPEPPSFDFVGAKSIDEDGTAHYEVTVDGDTVRLEAQTDYEGALSYLWQIFDAESGEYINIDEVQNPTAVQQTLELAAADVLVDTDDAYRCAVTATGENAALEKYALFTVVPMADDEDPGEIRLFSGGSTSQSDLEADLADGAATLSTDLTLTGDLNIGNNVLTIDSGATLTVPSGLKLESSYSSFDSNLMVKNGTLNIETGGELKANYVALGSTGTEGVQQDGHLILDGVGGNLLTLTAYMYSDGSSVTGQNASNIQKHRNYPVYTEAQFEAAIGVDSSAYNIASIDVAADISLTKVYTVAAASNKAVSVADNATLTVANGGSLTMLNDYRLSTQRNGHVLIQSGGSVDVTCYTINSGSIVVKSGGTLTSRASATTAGSIMAGSAPSLTVEAGGVYNLHGTLVVTGGENASIRIDGALNTDANKSISLSAGQTDISGAGISGDDYIYIYGNISTVNNDASLEAAISFANSTEGWVLVDLTGDLNASHTLPDNVELRVSGSACRLNSGTLTVNALMHVQTSFTVASEASLVNNGTILVGFAVTGYSADGTLTVDGGYSGTGSVTMNTPGSLVNGTNAVAVTGHEEPSEATVTTEAQLTQAIQQNASQISINGDITLTDSLTVPYGTILNVNAVLTVPAATTLITHSAVNADSAGAVNIGGTFECYGFLNVDGASVAVLNGGMLQLGEGLVAFNGGSLTIQTGGTVLNYDGYIGIEESGTLTVQAEAQLENRGSLSISNTAAISGTLINSGYVSIQNEGTLTTLTTGTIINSELIVLGGSLNGTETNGFIVANGSYTGDGQVQLQTENSAVSGANASQITSEYVKNVTVTTDEQLDAALKASYSGFPTVNIIAQGNFTLYGEYILSETSPINLNITGSLRVNSGAKLTIQNEYCVLALLNASLIVEDGGSVDTTTLFADRFSSNLIKNGGSLAFSVMELKDSSLSVEEGGSIENNDCVLLTTSNSSLTMNGTYTGIGLIIVENIAASVGGSTLPNGLVNYNLSVNTEEDLRAAVNRANEIDLNIAIKVTGNITLNSDLFISENIDVLSICDGAQLTLAHGDLRLDSNNVQIWNATLTVAEFSKLINNRGITLGSRTDEGEFAGHLVIDGLYEGEGNVTLLTADSTVTGATADEVKTSAFASVSSAQELEDALAASYTGKDTVVLSLSADISLDSEITLPAVKNIRFILFDGDLTLQNGSAFILNDSVEKVYFDGGSVTVEDGVSLELTNFSFNQTSLTMRSASTLSIAGQSITEMSGSTLTVESGATFNNAGYLFLFGESAVEINGVYHGKNTVDYDPVGDGFIVIMDTNSTVTGSGVNATNTYYSLTLASQAQLIECCNIAATVGTAICVFFVKELTITTDITLPSNVRMAMYGAPLTVASGTFTVMKELRLLGSDMVVSTEASLVNNGNIDIGATEGPGTYLDSSLSLSGSYSGTGTVYILTPDSFVCGMNASALNAQRVLKCYLDTGNLESQLSADYSEYTSVEFTLGYDVEITDTLEIPLQDNMSIELENASLFIKDGGSLILNGGRMQLHSTSQIQVQSGGSLVLGSVVNLFDAGSVTVQDGGSMSINAQSLSLFNNSSLTVDGTLAVYGGAALQVSSGELVNNGSITLGFAASDPEDSTNGTMQVNGGYSGTGSVTLLTSDSEVTGTNASSVPYTSATDPAYTQAELEEDLADGEAVLTSDLTLTGDLDIGSNKLTIDSGATLTVPSGFMIINNTNDCNILVKNGTLNIETGGDLRANLVGLGSTDAEGVQQDGHLILNGVGGGAVSLVAYVYSDGSSVSGANASSIPKLRYRFAYTEEQFETELGSDDSAYNISYIEIVDDISLTKEYIIAAASSGKFIEVLDGSTLTVANGASLTMPDGNRLITKRNGHVLVQSGGSVDVPCYTIDSGSIVVKSGGTLTSRTSGIMAGAIMTGASPSLSVEAGGVYNLHGTLTVTVATNASIIIDGTLNTDADRSIEINDIEQTDISGAGITGDNYIYYYSNKNTVNDDASLEAAIDFANSTEGGVFVSLSGSLHESHTIPENVELWVRSGAYELTSGILTLAGQLHIAGTFMSEGEASLTVASEASLVNNGEIYLGYAATGSSADGVLTVDGGYSGTGSITMNTPGSLVNGTNAAAVTDPAYTQAELEEDLADGEAVLTSDLTLTGDLDIGSNKLTIDSGATLTVPSGLKLFSVNINIDDPHIVVKNGTLNIEAGGELYAASSVGLGSTDADSVQQDGHLILNGAAGNSGPFAVSMRSDGSTVTGANASDVSKRRKYPIYTEEQFEAALGADNSAYHFTSVEILGDIDLSKTYTVDADLNINVILLDDSTLTVKNGGSFTMADGNTFTVNSTSRLLIESGGSLDVIGYYIFASGSIVVKSGGVLTSRAGNFPMYSKMSGSAPSLIVEAGGVYNLYGSLHVEATENSCIRIDGTLNTNADESVVFLSDYNVDVSGAGITGDDCFYYDSADGDASLEEAIDFANTVEGRVLVTLSGNLHESHTIPENVMLWLYDTEYELSSGTLTVEGELRIDNAFTVASEASLINNGEIYVGYIAASGSSADGVFTVNGGYSGAGCVILCTPGSTVNGTNAAAVTDPAYTQAELEEDLADGEAVLTSDLTLTSDLDIGDNVLTIDSGATLTVPSGLKLISLTAGSICNVAVKDGTLNIETGGELSVNPLALGSTESDGTQKDGHLIFNGTCVNQISMVAYVYSDGSSVTGLNASAVAKGRYYSVYTEAQFEAAVNADGSEYAFQTIRILGDISLTKEYTIATSADKNVKVLDNSTLTVANGGSLTISEPNSLTVDNNGHVVVENGGSMDVACYEISSGSIVVESGGTLTSRMNTTWAGSIMSGASPSLIVEAGGVYNLHGALIVNSSEAPELRIDGTLNTDADRSIKIYNINETDISGAGISGDDYIYLYRMTNMVNDDASLEAAIDVANNTEGWVLVDLNGNLNASHTIPENVELWVRSAEHELSSGTLTVEGELYIDDTFIVASEASLVNNGVIYVGYVDNDNSIDGTFTVNGGYSGAGSVVMRTPGSLVNGTNGWRVTDPGYAQRELEEDLADGSATLSSDLTLTSDLIIGFNKLTIDSGATLTVPSGFKVESSNDGSGFEIAVKDGTLNIEAGAELCSNVVIFGSTDADGVQQDGHLILDGVDGGGFLRTCLYSDGSTVTGQSASSIYKERRYPVYTEAEFEAAVDVDSSAYGYASIEVVADMSLTKAYTIAGASNKHIMVVNGSTLTVANGGSLTMLNDCRLSTQRDGHVLIQSGGSVDVVTYTINSGSIVVKSGGTLTSYASLSYGDSIMAGDSPSLIVEAGGVYNLNGNLSVRVSSNPCIRIDGTLNTLADKSIFLWSINDTDISGAGITGDDYIYLYDNTYAVNDDASLEAAIDFANSIEGWVLVNLTGSLNASHTIPHNVELRVSYDAYELTSGTLTFAGEMYITRAFTVASGASLVNNGEIYIGFAVTGYSEDATLTVNGSYSGAGSVTMLTSGSVINGTNAESVTNVNRFGTAVVNTEAELKDAVLRNAPEIKINSDITLTSSLNIPSSTIISLNAALTVASGVTLMTHAPLNMSSGAALNISGMFISGGYIDVDDAEVSVLSGGQLNLGESICVHDGGSLTAKSGAVIANIDGNIDIAAGGTLTVEANAQLVNDGSINISNVAVISGKLINSGYIGIQDGGRLATAATGSIDNSGIIVLGSSWSGTETNGFIVANGTYSGEGAVQFATLGSRITGTKATQIPYEKVKQVNVNTNEQLDAALKANYPVGFDCVDITLRDSLTLTEKYELSESLPVNMYVEGMLTVADGASLRVMGADSSLALMGGVLTIEGGGTVSVNALSMMNNSSICVKNGGALVLDSAWLESGSITVDAGGSLENINGIALSSGACSMLVNGSYTGDGGIYVMSTAAFISGTGLTGIPRNYDIRVETEAELRAAISFAIENDSDIVVSIVNSFTISSDLHIPSEIDFVNISMAQLTVSGCTLTLDAYTGISDAGTLLISGDAKIVNNMGISVGTNSDNAEYPSTDGHLVLDGEYEGEGSVTLETDGSDVTGDNADALRASKNKYISVSTAALLDRALRADYSGYDFVNIKLTADISISKAYTLPAVSTVNFDLNEGNLTLIGYGSLVAGSSESFATSVNFNGGSVILRPNGSLKLNDFGMYDTELSMQKGSRLSTAYGCVSGMHGSSITADIGATIDNGGNISIRSSTVVINGTYIGSDSRYNDTDGYGFIVIGDADSSVSGAGVAVHNTLYSFDVATQQELINACAIASQKDTDVFLFSNQAITVNEDITLPGNVHLLMLYSPLTVSAGTFTVNRDLRIIGSTMTVASAASLVNNGVIEVGATFSLGIDGNEDGNLVIDGTYSGTGSVYLRTSGSTVTGANAEDASGRRVMKYYLGYDDPEAVLSADYSEYDEVQIIVDVNYDIAEAITLPLQENICLILRDCEINVNQGGSLTVIGAGKMLLEQASLIANSGGSIVLNGYAVSVQDGGLVSAKRGGSVTVSGSALNFEGGAVLSVEGVLRIVEGGAVNTYLGANMYNKGTVYMGTDEDASYEQLHVSGEYEGTGRIINPDGGNNVEIGDYSFTVTGPSEVASGKSVRLIGAFAPKNRTNTSIVWSLAEGDEEYVKLTPIGLNAMITAKAVSETHIVTVTARAIDGSVSNSYEMYVNPLVQDIEIKQEDSTVNGQTLVLDIYNEDKTLQLTTQTYPEDASDAVIWSSSNRAVATVDKDTGLVTGVRPGTVTIKAAAADGSGKYATVRVQVIYVDAIARLSSASDNEPIPKIGLQKGNTTTMQVFGTDKSTPMTASLFTYTIPAAQSAIATVDENGVITAGDKPGTAIVTAALTGDPLRRSVRLIVKVIPLQTQDLLLTPVISDDELPTLVMLDANGDQTVDVSQAVRYELILDKTALGTGRDSYSFTITPTGTYSDGTEIAAPVLSYVSSDPRIATVSVARDGTVNVAVKKTAASVGECTITGTSKDLAKISNIITIQVRDYSPRIGVSSLTFNPMLSEGASTPLLASYGNNVNSVELYEYNPKTRDYDIISTRLSASFADDTLTILPIGTPTNATVRTLISVDCYMGVYTIPLTVIIRNALPSISVRQSERFDLFYTDSEVALTVKVAGCAVTDIALKPMDAETFAGVYNDDGESITIRYSDTPEYNAGRPYSALTLLVSVEGYTEPIEKLVVLSAMTTRLALSCMPTSSYINTRIGEPQTSFTIYNRASRSVLDLDTGVNCEDADVVVNTNLDTDTVYLEWRRESNGRATISVQNSNWVRPVMLTHSVTVSTTLPAAKLGAPILRLSNIYTAITADTSLTLNQAGVSVKDVIFESTARGTLLDEANKLELSYIDGVITAGIKDGETPRAGTYGFKVTPQLEGPTADNGDDVALRTVAMYVSVTAAAPRVSLVSPALRLNNQYSGEVATSGVKLSLAGYEVTDVTAARVSRNKLDDDAISIGIRDGLITATLNDDVAKGVYGYILTPTVRHIDTDQSVDLSTVVLNVNVISSTAVSASVMASGRLDAINRESSAITYTVARLNNITGTLQSPELLGPDKDKFELSNFELNAKGQPTLKLTLLPNEDYATNVAYKLQLGFGVEGVSGLQVKSQALSIRVIQSAVRLKISPTVTSVFQSATSSMSFDLDLISPLGANIAEVSLNPATTLALRQALGDEPITFDQYTGEITVNVPDTSRLKVGGGYVLVLDVMPEGMATNLKPTPVRTTIRAYK